ncbi:GGDEF domain-containing protein [Pseudomonas mangiferae]|uniref:diguanylate cyclase n=1 Tax=Pseudomonas mangiferae TaxID=2593654 RepID=A0A553GVW3_9PSED|nr:GGDEF domain-containing protein [Pseudomonas mangiferae]TRX73596.1 GGDEF domain-containing protein [Pseudomonas mangiferae]
MLDPRSIIFILSALSLLMAVVLFAMPRSVRERVGGARYWSSAMLMVATASLLYGLRGMIPDFFSLTLANFAGLGSIALICAGGRCFFERPPRHAALLGSVLLANALMFYFFHVEDRLAVRVVIFSSLSAALMAYFGLDVLRHRPRQPDRAQFPYLFTAGSVFIDVAISGLRILNALAMPTQGGDFLAPTPINVLYFSTHSLLAICISVGFILMLNDRLHALLMHQLSHDALTNAYTRRIVVDMATRELAAGARKPASLLLLDIDHFKRVNDERGHQTGDEVLKHVVRVLIGGLRANEPLGRYGGEEFIVLLRGTDLDTALQVGERLRARIAASPYRGGGDADPQAITVSIGVATARPDETLEQWLRRTDTALYDAKRHGRNCVVAG